MFAVGLVIGAPSAAAFWPTFSSPSDLTPADAQSFNPQVAVGGDGGAVALWRRTTAGGSVVQAATRPAGGSWTAPVDLTAAVGDALQPQLAVSAEGGAVAVWRHSTGSGSVVQAATRPAAGGWSAPVDLTPAGASALDPQVATGGEGHAVAVWTRITASGSVVQAATRSAAGRWSPPTDLSTGEREVSAARVATNDGGERIAVWSSMVAGRVTVRAAMRPPGGEWSSATEVGPAGVSVLDPHVALAADGDAVAIWARSVGSGSVVQAVTRSAGEDWSAPADLTTAQARVGVRVQQVALSADGSAVAVWARATHRNDGSILHSAAEAATRAAGGSWSRPSTLSPANTVAFDPQPAMSPDGDALALWTGIVPGGGTAVQVATRAARSSWSAPIDLTRTAPGAAASSPDVAVGGNGDAAAVWQTATPSGSVVQAAVAASTDTPPFLESRATWREEPPTFTPVGVLERGTVYRVTVKGTYSLWSAKRVAASPEPGWVVCGRPLDRPMFPSLAVTNGRTTGDAEFLFARPQRGTACSDEVSAALPERRPRIRFSVDGAATFHAVAPEDGVPGRPDPDHAYMYTLTGAGQPLTVAFADSFYLDNAGQLRVTVEPAAS
ncbi:MAG TPA: hypothetical protein VHJ39_12860 [Solirubrobacteraceae bacterium]|nr:hypothetical protein [Solirubrobacteraceae bacterium]